MIPQTAIVQIAKKIGRELNSGAEPSEDALAAGPILAEAGATPEIVGRLLAEAQRNRPSDRMIHAYAFMLEGALGTLRVQASGGDVAAGYAIAAVHKEVADNLRKSSIAPDVLMLVARAFARAELDPGRSLQEAMTSAMEAQAPSMPAPLSPEDFSDHFAELAATFDNDPFAIYAELATMAAAFPAEHQAAMAGVIAMSQSEAVREAALGFAFTPNSTVSSAALVAVSQQRRGGMVSSKMVDRLVRMRPWLSEMRRADIDTAVRALRPKAASPVPVKRWEIRGVLASLCDGAGAQSLFASPNRGAASRWLACW